MIKLRKKDGAAFRRPFKLSLAESILGFKKQKAHEKHLRRTSRRQEETDPFNTVRIKG